MISILGVFVLSAAITQGPTSCTNCHGSDLFPPQERAKVQKMRDDVHAQVGLSCHDCHGGNPDPNADMAAAMDAKFKSNPFIGRPKRTQIPEFCGKCHSNADYMKRFNPAARVDQLTEYKTSVHGQRLAKGDENVATCIDCHSVHGIRRKGNPDSPVYPTHVAETCSHCHSDAKRMAQYNIPTNQYARWRVSVHANALFEKHDLTAPTCNVCHGNHGATPPGVASVSFVCGNCHGREAESFRKSKKYAGWQQHNELLATGAKCGDCHADARAKVQVAKFTDCVTCHENHGVVRPSVAMLGNLPDVPCAFCHEGTGQLAAMVPEPPSKAAHYREVRDQLLSAAARQHLTGDARFDWLVDQAQGLYTHHLPPTRTGEASPLRPEFARLFEKFRIGKTHPAPGIVVRSCRDCHLESDSAGTANARHFLGASRGLTSMIARAERIQLSAHRGGVETRQAQTELDSAVDNQIELEAMVHTFAQPEVQKKEEEGLQHAEAALWSAQKSLDELTYRRSGLLVALGIILCVLFGLAIKIRTL
jgi:nitrate/TMAO reductase-like tetraheme cytochrome c subunit